MEYSVNLCADMENLPRLLAVFSANQRMLLSVATTFAKPAPGVGTLKTVKKFVEVSRITIWLLPVEVMAKRMVSTHVTAGWNGDELGEGLPLANGRTNSLIEFAVVEEQTAVGEQGVIVSMPTRPAPGSVKAILQPALDVLQSGASAMAVGVADPDGIGHSKNTRVPLQVADVAAPQPVNVDVVVDVVVASVVVIVVMTVTPALNVENAGN